MNELSKIPEVKSITDIVRHSKELPTISSLLRKNDIETENQIKGEIGLLIKAVYVMYGVNDLPDEIMIPIIVQVKESMRLLTIEDIRICKKKILTNKYYDKFNPKINPGVLLRMIEDYKQDRMEAFELNSSIPAPKEKEPLSERSKELIDEILTITKPKEKQMESKPKNKYQLELKEKYNQILKDFDRIWKEQGKTETVNDIPIIDIDGKNMVRSQYIDYRNK